MDRRGHARPTCNLLPLDAGRRGRCRTVYSGKASGDGLHFAMFYSPDSVFTRTMIQVRGVAGCPSDGFFSSLSHDDAAPAMVAALVTPGGAYNVVAYLYMQPDPGDL